GIGPTTIVSASLFGPSVLLIAVAPTGNRAIPVLVFAQLVIGFSVVAYNIVQVSYRQEICPPRLQGRMNSVMRFIVWGTIPLWSGQTISQFGTQVSLLAIPLTAVLVLDASAFEVAQLSTVEYLPFLLFALPAGVWVDRLSRRPILIAADLARGAALGSIPLAYAFGALTIWQLYAV